MKTLVLFVLLIASAFSFSQSCGNSGPAQCTPTGTLPPGTFTPNEDIACLIRGQAISSGSEFTNFVTIGPASVNGLRVDSMSNLPAGLCWATNKTNDSLGSGETGCIHLTGVTTAPCGQYKLAVFVTVITTLGTFSGELSALAAQYSLPGFEPVFLRLIDQSFSFCPQVDNSQSVPFVPYDLNTNLAEIRGKLFFDVNQNQVFDIGEQSVSNQLLTVSNNYLALTNQTGEYRVYTSPGVNIIKPSLSGNLSTFSFHPDSIVITVDSGISYPDNDFGIITPAGFCEGTINLIASNTPPRPGFDNILTVRFTNIISAAAVSQDVRLTYDSNQTFVSANPAPASVDTVNRIITWNISNLNSASHWQGLATFYTPSTVAIGTVLNYSTVVDNSSCAALDVLLSDEEAIVVGAYDPNDKSVSPVGQQPGGRILPSSTLNYTVRFQNTGNYMAENVSVVDTISTYLNLSTLKVLAASHSYEVVIRGREVTFQFSNINLPDSFSNEPLSHGYIKYSIQPTVGFVQNSIVQNRADIYFDFNEPIRTNTTTNTADNFIGIQKMAASDLSFEIYPNPLSDGNWQLITTPDSKGKAVHIYSIEGRLVHSQQITSAKTEIDASSFSKGVYIVRIENVASRLIKL